jgi:hypothetical protein
MAISVKSGSLLLGLIELMDNLSDDLLGVKVIVDGWKGGMGCGKGESVLCVVLCGTS